MMTAHPQNLPPPLIRSTHWQMDHKLWWGIPSTTEVEGAFIEDALEALETRGIRCDRVIAARFWCLHAQQWRHLPQKCLQEAICLVTSLGIGA